MSRPSQTCLTLLLIPLISDRGTTPRLVRQMIEKQYNLESGTLDAPEYKSAIKAATAAAVVR